MPSFFDLQRYAATGIASPDMTAFDKMRALAAFGGSTVQTLTGQPPLSFKADGTPLISWSMKGNGSQTGTPSPQSIIMPTFCGVRTANVMPAGENKIVSDNGITFESDGNGRYHIHGTATAYASARFYLVSGFTTPISISNGGQGTLSLFNSQATSDVTFVFYNGGTKVDDWKTTSLNRTSTAYNAVGNKYVNNVVITVVSGSTVDITIAPEFTNDGVLPSRFEPYGWAEKITCAGQTVPVYLGQTQTVRRIKKVVLTGQETYNNYQYSSSNGVQVTNILNTAYRRASGICSIYPVSTQAGTTYCLWIGSGGSDRNLYFISILNAMGLSTASDFKTYVQQQYAAGTPVTIWYVLATPETAIVNEPLAKIGDYADELSSTDAGVAIPTVKGQNTLTVETELQPSEMTITYRG